MFDPGGESDHYGNNEVYSIDLRRLVSSVFM